MTVSRDAATDLEISNPDGMFDPEPFAFSQLAIVPSDARLIFIAGQGGGGSPKGDFTTQVKNALQSIGMAMTSAGGAMGGVAKLTIKAYPLDAGVATSCEAQPPGRRRTFVAGTCE